MFIKHNTSLSSLFLSLSLLSLTHRQTLYKHNSLPPTHTHTHTHTHTPSAFPHARTHTHTHSLSFTPTPLSLSLPFSFAVSTFKFHLIFCFASFNSVISSIDLRLSVYVYLVPWCTVSSIWFAIATHEPSLDVRARARPSRRDP